ncbi:zinc finger protein 165-like [Tiliqua scincoides]|uniref:zinc finger protein 165-like n=1 Tax=Tiliqua scincoides TaxID=71010 RepID=UPI003461FB62
MKEETCEGPKAEDRSGGAGKAPDRDQPEAVMEPQKGQEGPGRRVQQHWEAQWQEFLKTLQAPQSTLGSPQLPEATPWDDAKAFLASFEQVAAACRWPRGEWVARLLPALSGEAQQAFSLLAARDKEDYGKVKAAILRGDALRREAQRQHFRQFCCPELGDPRRMYSQLQELCCQWLKPERHTKEQILELLVLEQFLASLPVDVQSWIRAGGPDSCTQAVVLLEDFLVNRREASTGMWQEPLQEWALGPLDVKEEPLDMVQGEISNEQAEIFRNTQQNVSGEVAVPGTGITRPTLLLPPEDQNMDEAEQSKALGAQVDQVMNPSKTGGTLHMVEQTPMQSSQQTMFWQVLQEDGDNVDSMVKKEKTFFLDPVESQRIRGQDSDDGKRTQLKVKNPQLGGNEPLETPRRGRGRTQEKVPVTTEVKEERCESNSRQGMEPYMGCKESSDLTEGLGASCSTPTPMNTEGGKALFSKYGRRYRPKSGLVSEHSGEQCTEDLEKHHSSQMEEKNNDRPEVGASLHSSPLTKHQRIHPAENPHKCPTCGKSFSWRSNLSRHKNIHIGEKGQKCPECGKRFRDMSDVRRHQTIHAEVKPYQCTECGKQFSERSVFLRHQMIHTGKKPYECPECGKGFCRRSQLLIHQYVHTGEKPHKCSDCGRSFFRMSDLSNHQKIHTERHLAGETNMD